VLEPGQRVLLHRVSARVDKASAKVARTGLLVHSVRLLATQLPLDALVLETDAPDIPPHWLYVTAEARAQGVPQGRNSPDQIPRIAQVLADLRGLSLETVRLATRANVCSVLAIDRVGSHA
jgi:Tat protein secretion system quality control protein TatD with DNase activity